MRFEHTDELRGAEFIGVDLSGAVFRNVNLQGAKVMEAMLVNARFSGLTHGLVVTDMSPSFITDPEPYGIDLHASPGLAEVLVAREERMEVVRDLVRTITNDDLQRRCGDQTVLSCLHTLFDEEWHHNWFANRDLDEQTQQP